MQPMDLNLTNLYISDIKGPKKLFPDLSFGNADLDKVEVRKSQLDTFLKVGCNHFFFHQQEY